MAMDLTVGVIGHNGVVTVVKGKKTCTVVVNGKGVRGSDAKIDPTKLTVNGKPPTNVKVRKQPYKWVVSFEMANIVFDTDYKFHIEDDKSHSGNQTFQFHEAVKAVKDRFDPPSGTEVDGSGFYVTVYDPLDLSVYAGIQTQGGPWYGGMLVEQPPPNAVIYFEGIPPGEGYTITVVVWDSPPQYSFSSDIKVT